MSRQEDMKVYAKELLEDRFLQDIAAITQELKKPSALEELKNSFDMVFKKAERQQENEEKDEIAFVMVFCLRSSIVTKSYDFLIQLYDESMYYDMTETCGVWTPKRIMGYYQQQVEYFEQEVKKVFIRVQKSELIPIERELAGDYYKIAFGFLVEHIQDIVELESFHRLRKTDGLQIQYGGIYDTCIPIYDIAEGVLL